MSGHSKWANIKARKGAQDKKRSAAFTKMAKLILTAVRQGGGKTDPEANSYLRVAVDKAREVNMPRENIERLLKSFEERKNNLAAYTLEGYGPFGVPIVVEVETDNKNRILGEVKSIFKSYNGNLGESGSVMFLFRRVGEIELENDLSEEQQLTAIDWGASDFEEKIILTDPNKLNEVIKKVEENGFKVVESNLSLRCQGPVVLDSEDQFNQIMDLVETLEETEDVINVHAGFDYAQAA